MGIVGGLTVKNGKRVTTITQGLTAGSSICSAIMALDIILRYNGHFPEDKGDRTTFLLLGAIVTTIIFFIGSKQVFAKANVFFYIKIRIQTYLVSFLVVVQQSTLLVYIVYSKVIIAFVSSCACRQGILLCGGWFKNCMEPVCTRLGIFLNQEIILWVVCIKVIILLYRRIAGNTGCRERSGRRATMETISRDHSGTTWI